MYLHFIFTFRYEGHVHREHVHSFLRDTLISAAICETLVVLYMIKALSNVWIQHGYSYYSFTTPWPLIKSVDKIGQVSLSPLSLLLTWNWTKGNEWEIGIHTEKNQGVFAKHYAPGGNKVEKAIFSFKVKVKVTRSLTLGSFERVCVLVFYVTCNDFSVIYVTAQMCRRTEEEVVPTVGLPTP